MDSVRALYEGTKRKAQRAEVMKNLQQPGVTFTSAQFLVEQLKGLQPAEDPAAALFVKRWDVAVASADELRKQIADTQAAFEAGISGNGTITLPPDVVAKVKETATAVKTFRAGEPPAAVKVPAGVSDTMLAIVEKLPVIDKEIAAREYLQAKDVLDPIMRDAGQIGPKSAAAIGALQRKVMAEVEKFRMLREEAKMLADNEKIEEAVKKYEEAFAVIPAKDVASQIEALKKQL